MPRRPAAYDPQAILYAREAVAGGRSLREVAAELTELGTPVSHNQVAKWCKGPPPTPAEPGAVVADRPRPEPEPARQQSPAPGSAGVDPKLAARLEAQRARAAEPPTDASPEVPADDAPFDYEAELQRMIRAAQREVREFEQSSNPRAAQAAARRASDLMKVLAQTEKRKPTDPDVLTFSRADIEREYDRIVGVLQTLCARPVLCAECSRALSVKFGKGEA